MKRTVLAVLVATIVTVAACGGSTGGGSSASAGGAGAATGGAAGAAVGGSRATGGSPSGGTGGSDATGGSGGARICAVVSGDYGDCAAIVGWGFDGTVCRSYRGCGCEPDCAHIFDMAVDCIAACRAEQHCNTAALTPGGIAGEFVEGAFCDEVFACAPSYLETDLDQLIGLSSACEGTSQCATGMTCPTELSGYLYADGWDSVCSASLLPDVELTCWVWGP